jgi:hypothetical protein
MSVTIPGSGNVVIQVVSVPFTTGYSYASVGTGAYTDTAITASITPKFASSKILVQISCTLGMAYTDGNSGITTAIKRNSSTVAGNFGAQVNSGTNSEYSASVPFIQYLDSPATASATTYTLQVKTTYSATTAYVNRTYYASSGFQAVITLTEISQA